VHYQSSSHVIVHAFRARGDAAIDAATGADTAAASFDPEARLEEEEEEEPADLLSRVKAPKGSIASFVDRARATVRAQRKKEEAKKKQQQVQQGGGKARGKGATKRDRQRQTATKRSVRHKEALRSAFLWVPQMLISECALLERQSRRLELSVGAGAGAGSDEHAAGRAGWEVQAAVEHAGTIAMACRLVGGASDRVLQSFVAAAATAEPMSALAARCLVSGCELVKGWWRTSSGGKG